MRLIKADVKYPEKARINKPRHIFIADQFRYKSKTESNTKTKIQLVSVFFFYPNWYTCVMVQGYTADKRCGQI